MQTKHTKLLLTLIFVILLASSISYATGISSTQDDLKQAISTKRVYWTCAYHPNQRFYSTNQPGVQGCSYSPDRQHVWTEHVE